MNATIVEQNMIVKYFNRIMIVNVDETFIESWNILNHEQKMNEKIDDFENANKIDAFKIEIEKIVTNLYEYIKLEFEFESKSKFE